VLPCPVLCENLVSAPAITLYYQSDCGLCPAVIEACASRAEALGAPILIRKPTLEELRSGRIPGYPALFVPAGVKGLARPYLLVGAGLENLLDQLLSSTDG